MPEIFWMSGPGQGSKWCGVVWCGQKATPPGAPPGAHGVATK